MILNTPGRLELLGHVCLFGHLSEEEVAGVKMIRIDIVKESETIETRYYGTGAVYCISPLSEEALIEATRAPIRRVAVASYTALDDLWDEDGEQR